MVKEGGYEMAALVFLGAPPPPMGPIFLTSKTKS